MGIYGLEKFYETRCDTSSVSIQALLDKFRNENGFVEKIKIVVDGSNCLRHLYGDLDWMFGGQMRQYREKARRFVEKFKALNVDLVFFFDGPTVERKRKEWVKRRCQSMVDVRKILNSLAVNNTRMGYNQLKSQLKSNNLFMLPPGIGNVARFSFKLEFGCEVHVSVRENDEEVAEYARKNNCFAILAQDTDFIILEGAKYYLSMKHLNIVSMTTIIYDRESLAKVLQIKTKELPLFATLRGNDIISVDMLRWGKKFVDHAYVANYIRKLSIKTGERTLENKDDLDKMYKEISVDVFGSEENYMLIKASVESYTADSAPDSTIIDALVASCPSPSEEWRKILEEGLRRHKDGKTSAQVWAILAGKPFELSTTIEDFSANDLPAAATVFRPLRQRIYGVLLKEKPLPEGQSCHTVHEWCVDGNFNENSTAVPVEALTPSVPHPGLLTLWNSKISDKDTINKRWNLFVRTISPNINVKKLKNIDAHLVLPTVAIKMLAERVDSITYDEVRALAALAVRTKKHPLIELERLKCNTVTERAVRLATLYMRAFGMLTILITSLDGPIPLRDAMPWNSFDGLLFQQMYKTAVNFKRDDYILVYNDPSAYKQYASIMKLISY